MENMKQKQMPDLMVEVSQNGKTLWRHGFTDGIRQGLSSKSYRTSGLLSNILNALQLATSQARGELGLTTDDPIGVLDSSTVPGEVDD